MKSITLIILMAISLGIFVFPGSAMAVDKFKSVESATPQEISDGIGSKLARGVANIATGWVEFPKQIYVTTKEDGWGKGLIVGPFKGFLMTVTRTVAGVAELGTFFIPYPGFYEPYFDPAFVWQAE